MAIARPRRSKDAPAAGAASYHQRIRGAKREAVVEAAMEVFMEHGYARGSLQQVASRAGVSTATLFKRFPSKASLFEAIVLERWRFDAGDVRPLQIGRPLAGLRRIGRQFASLARQPEMVAFYRMFIGEAHKFPELGRLMLERGKLPYQHRVSEYLRSEMEAGNLGACDSMRVAAQFMAMISDQLFWPVLLVPGVTVSEQDAKDVVDEAVLTIMARCALPDRMASKVS